MGPVLETIREWNIARVIYAYLSCSAIIARIGKANTMQDLADDRIIFIPTDTPEEGPSGPDIAYSFSLREMNDKTLEAFYKEMLANILEKAEVHESILNKLGAPIGRFCEKDFAVRCASEVLDAMLDVAIVCSDRIRKTVLWSHMQGSLWSEQSSKPCRPS
jgi:hypothetical protein